LRKFYQGSLEHNHSQDIIHVLENYRSSCEDSIAIKVDSLIEQFRLMHSKKERHRYYPHFLIFCSILYSISPQAYKFFRNSDHIILPDKRTIQRLCSSHQIYPRREQDDSNFLSYTKQKFAHLSNTDRTVSLMLDEIHIKPYIDYKGDNVVGTAYNSIEIATTAHVFMIQSLLSNHKDVVHIMPVKKIDAEQLFNFIKKVIMGLHNIGFEVICLVSDNNAINHKVMTFFSTPPKLSIVYPHPACSSKPLFYINDSVHIFKCIRNNWINQKDYLQSIHFPIFDKLDEFEVVSFTSIKKLHSIECRDLVKYSYGLTSKSLNPSTFERQNVKLVLNVFNSNVCQGLLTYGEQNNIPHYNSTLNFIKIINNW
jgi:hypothetical protein